MEEGRRGLRPFTPTVFIWHSVFPTCCRHVFITHTHPGVWSPVSDSQASHLSGAVLKLACPPFKECPAGQRSTCPFTHSHTQSKKFTSSSTWTLQPVPPYSRGHADGRGDGPQGFLKVGALTLSRGGSVPGGRSPPHHGRDESQAHRSGTGTGCLVSRTGWAAWDAEAGGAAGRSGL